MNTRPHLTAIAKKHYQPVSVKSTSFCLYYGDNKKAWYGPAPYSWCKAEENRLLLLGQGYRRELFKIKP